MQLFTYVLKSKEAIKKIMNYKLDLLSYLTKRRKIRMREICCYFKKYPLIGLFIWLIIFNACTPTVTNQVGNTTTDPSTVISVPLDPNGTPATSVLGGQYLITSSPIDPCATNNIKVSFTLSGKNIPSNTTILWTFGDGNISTDKPTTANQYAKTGTYTVIARVLDSNRVVQDSAETTFTFPAPVASFVATRLSQTTSANNYLFRSTSTGNIDKYIWSFTDGSIDETNSPSIIHGFPLSNPTTNYNVTLTVRNANGCFSTTTKNASVLAGGNLGSDTITYSQTDPCGPNGSSEQFTFTCKATTLTAGTSLIWDFGDNTSQTGTIVTHNYTTRGNYLVTVTARKGTSVLFIAQKMVQAIGIVTLPISQFDTIRTSAYQFTFINKSSLSQGKITNYIWDYGDGFTTPMTTNTSVIHAYPIGTVDKNYTVTLTTISEQSCTNKTSKTLTILKQ